MRYVKTGYLGVLGALGLTGLSACGSSSEKTLRSEVTDSVEKAVNAGDVKRCAERFTEDAEILQEDSAVVRGKQAIVEFCAAQIHPQLSLDTVSAMSIVSGDLAFEQGTYRFRNVKIGVNVEFGEYLNVWRRQGKQWRIFRSMFDKTETLPTEVSVSEPD
jgi:ketosteroid isomerase-like protein